MRNLALVFLGFLLLVLHTAFATVFPVRLLAPNLLLPIAIHLGVSAEVSTMRGAAIAFVLGYLLDSFCGSPMGLLTFVLVGTFLVARFAGLRFFLRGPLFQLVLTFVVSVVAGGTIVALRAIFERPAPFPVRTLWDTFVMVFGPAFATALVAPLIFAMVRRIDLLPSRRREEGALTV